MFKTLNRILEAIKYRTKNNYFGELISLIQNSNWYQRKKLKYEVNELINNKIIDYPDTFNAFGFSIDDTVSFEELKTKLERNRGIKETCNIVGSGKSALKAVNLYNEQEAYFSSNFACILDIPFDVYTIEIGTYKFNRPKDPIISKLQADAIKNCIVKPKYLIVKNIWQNTIDKPFLKNNYSEFDLIRDILLPKLHDFENKKYYDLLFDFMFNKNQYFVCQAHTTIVTLIQFAVWSGYKVINVYGLEGKGSHFFHMTDIISNKNLLTELRTHIHAVDDDVIHESGYNGRKLVLKMTEYLKRSKNVTLNLIN